MHQRTEVRKDEDGHFRAITVFWFAKNAPLDIRTCSGALLPVKVGIAEHVRVAGRYERWQRDVPQKQIQTKLEAWRKACGKAGFTGKPQQYEGA